MSVISGVPNSGIGVPSGRDANPPTSRLDADAAQADPTKAVPVRARGVELLGELPGSGYRTPPALVRRADGQTIQLTRLLYLVLEAVDGRRTHAELADRVSTQYGRLVGAADIGRLVDGKLRPLGLLQQSDGSEPAVKRSQPLLGLRCRVVVTDPKVTRRVTAPFAVLFHPVIVTAVLAGFTVVCWWLLFDKGLASATYQAFERPGLLLTVFVLTVVSAGFHEFGHAAAARYGGATPGAMGAGLYLVWPAFYTDVTDSYRLGRAGRIRTDLGGLYFNAIVALVMFAVWAATGWDAILLIIATQVLQMIRQLAPLVRFDGYHLLADLTGVPDLYQRIKPTLSGLLPSRWGSPESKVLKPWARAVVTAWVLLVVPLLLFTMALIVVTLPRIVATALASIGRQSRLLDTQFQDGDFAAVLVRILSIVAIALPVLGIGYLLVRIARQAGHGIWRATSGRPAHRALAGVALAGVAIALAFAWWPNGDNYRPIQPYERGTVQDAIPLASSTPAGLREGGGGTAQTVWPGDAGPLPTADQPKLALVLVPRPGDSATGTATEDAPTWVFPFDRPLPPEEGDNQALAVNTTDGAVVYDVAFALVWADGATALNRNEAYAFASCTDCRTVAVAFQVVLVVGQVNVVVPQNIAAAVNYHCVECVTYALATQLVVTLPGPLSDGATAELAAVWAEIRAFGENVAGVPLAELRIRLTLYEARILDIIRSEVAASPTTTGAPGTTVPSAPAPVPPAQEQPAQEQPAQQPPAQEPPAQQPTETTVPPSTEPAPTTEPDPPPTSETSAPPPTVP